MLPLGAAAAETATVFSLSGKLYIWVWIRMWIRKCYTATPRNVGEKAQRMAAVLEIASNHLLLSIVRINLLLKRLPHKWRTFPFICQDIKNN